ncbi:MAG: bifunctional UDP-N-acetylglucosamine diphosphorylase/glucosamine-1-phosphate N-acetyltransferase GlmU [Candidatus Omnitrophota bacterium]|nr:MAG: bifunctional UDP-N-acetylglucosamine diphosphorylase/glucosamine-1-phosphate N-acetyltransferase GlmU [Candidatus Omnitrophota bacterium]
MLKEKTAVILLAAGKSTRMKSDYPKALHPILSRPMLGYCLDLVKSLTADKAILVLGHKHEQIKPLIQGKIKVVIQKKLIGTADAVKIALTQLNNFKGTVLVLYCDNPLLKKETIKNLLKQHIASHSEATLLTAVTDKPFGYGRILRDKYQSICGIIEEKDASDFQKNIKEINTGTVCFRKDSLSYALNRVKADNRKKEYYLTDTIGILYKRGSLIDSFKLDDLGQALGINSRSDLAEANKIMQRRINEDFMKNGITIVNPENTFISYGVTIGKDSIIYPFTVIDRNVKIGKRCKIGPFAHIRGGSRLSDDVSVGNFIEVNRSKLASKARAKHFSYLGDARVGRFVNIGAGTVTANYDGKKKNITVIGDKAFIGSDTILVAPVKIGKGAKTGAGSVVTRNRNVAANSTVVGVPAKPLEK